MFSKKQEKTGNRTERGQLLDARLDDLGRELTRAAQPRDEEIEAAVSTPFLYARIRARIAAEQERREAGEGSNWWAMLLTAWRPMAGMAVMAIIAAVVFLFSATGAGLPAGEEDSLVAGEPGVERMGGDPLTTDDVLIYIMNQDETDVPNDYAGQD
jgi:hypothetical protein